MLDFSIYPVMQNEIRKVVTKGKAAGVLRLVFHDAGTFELDDNSGDRHVFKFKHCLLDYI